MIQRKTFAMMRKVYVAPKLLKKEIVRRYKKKAREIIFEYLNEERCQVIFCDATPTVNGGICPYIYEYVTGTDSMKY